MPTARENALSRRCPFYDGYMSKFDIWLERRERLLAVAKDARKQVNFDSNEEKKHLGKQVKLLEQAAVNAQKREAEVMKKMILMQRRASLRHLLETEDQQYKVEIHQSRRYVRPNYLLEEKMFPVPGVPPKEDLSQLTLCPLEPPQSPPLSPPSLNVRDPVPHPDFPAKVRAKPLPLSLVKNPVLHLKAMKKSLPYERELTEVEKFERERRSAVIEEERKLEIKRMRKQQKVTARRLRQMLLKQLSTQQKKK